MALRKAISIAARWAPFADIAPSIRESRNAKRRSLSVCPAVHDDNVSLGRRGQLVKVRVVERAKDTLVCVPRPFRLPERDSPAVRMLLGEQRHVVRRLLEEQGKGSWLGRNDAEHAARGSDL